MVCLLVRGWLVSRTTRTTPVPYGQGADLERSVWFCGARSRWRYCKMTGMSTLSTELERARAAYAERSWLAAYEAFARADDVEPLAPEDLELLTTSLLMLARDDEAVASARARASRLRRARRDVACSPLGDVDRDEPRVPRARRAGDGMAGSRAAPPRDVARTGRGARASPAPAHLPARGSRRLRPGSCRRA